MPFKISNYIVAICIISILFVLNACNKEPNNSSTNVGVNKTLDYFSYVGKSHNEGLSSFFQQFTAEQVAAEKDNINNLDQFLIKSSNPKDQSFNNKLFASNLFNNLRNVNSHEMRENPTLNQVLSNSFFDEIDKVNSIIDSYNGVDIDYFTEQIENMEKRIVSSKNKLTVEDGILLSAISTAKYSGQYWTKNFIELKTSWGNNRRFLAREIRDENRDVTINKLVSADYSGAISGGIVGGLFGGTVATPLGAAPGWLAGAAAGGIGASLVQAIDIITDWLWPKTSRTTNLTDAQKRELAETLKTTLDKEKLVFVPNP